MNIVRTFIHKFGVAMLPVGGLIGAFGVSTILATYLMLPTVVIFYLETGSFFVFTLFTNPSSVTFSNSSLLLRYLIAWWFIGLPLHYAVYATYREVKND